MLLAQLASLLLSDARSLLARKVAQDPRLAHGARRAPRDHCSAG
jgi:hypothetical protein